jgi:hypothetical protein
VGTTVGTPDANDTRMHSLGLILCGGLVLLAAGCSSASPAPGTVLSSETFGIPPGMSLGEACSDACLGDGGVGCFECTSTTLSDGGLAGLCERVECGPPATGHE